MKFGYTIIYVSDVLASLNFFEKAFGFQKRFISEQGDYGELESGSTTLAFASHNLGKQNLPQGYVTQDSKKPVGIEIGLVTEDVMSAHHKALNAGASELAAPKEKPWGQMVSYVRCPDGTLVEICSPM